MYPTSEKQMEVVTTYKMFANYFYARQMLKRARKINKHLVSEYINYLNANGEKTLQHNKNDGEGFIQKNDINSVDFSEGVKKEFRKVHTNLIMIYFNMKKYKQCEDRIIQFTVIHDPDMKDEKVLFFKYKCRYAFNEYEESQPFLQKLIDLNTSAKSDYEKEMVSLVNLLNEIKRKKDRLVKRMFQFGDQ